MANKETPYKITLSEKEIPTAWYNIQPDLPNQLPPPLSPVTKEPAGPEDLIPLFPMELIKQEMSQEQFIDIPDEVREVYKLYRPSPAAPGVRPGEGSGHACQDILQGRERQPGGQPQAEHRRRPGLLQQEGGVKRICHRDRGRPVGSRPGPRLQVLRDRAAGVHGQGELRAEALQASDDGGLGGRCIRQPHRHDGLGSRGPGRGPGLARAAWGSR